MKKGLLENTKEVFAECLSVMEKKNNDYSGKADVNGLRNFEISADVANISIPKGILVRLMDKMTRIGNLLEHESKVKDEAIEDTVLDAINYCAILHFALKQEKQPAGEPAKNN